MRAILLALMLVVAAVVVVAPASAESADLTSVMAAEYDPGSTPLHYPPLNAGVGTASTFGTPIGGDFNADGYGDVAVIQSSGTPTLSFFLQQADGHLAVSATTYSLSAYSGGTIRDSGDLNGDGRDDIVFTTGNKKVVVYYQASNGTFAPTEHATTSVSANDARIADVNGDGRDDLIYMITQNIYILYQDAGGVLGGGITRFFTGSSSQLDVADFNGDGRLDLLVSHLTSISPDGHILYQAADGSMGQATAFDFAYTQGPNSVTVGDVTGDGLADIISASDVATVFHVQAQISGGFAPAVTYGISNPNSWYGAVEAIDANQDNRTDVLVNIGSSTRVFLQNAAGVLEYYTEYPNSMGNPVGDVNGDCGQDFAYYNTGLMVSYSIQALPIGTCTPRTGTARTFTVNTTTDTNDNVCDATHCSLREAINAANVWPFQRTIAFNILGDAPHSIRPTSALPQITQPMTIDGTTEPGFVNKPVIEIDGSGQPAGNGLFINAGSTTLRGLAFNRFTHTNTGHAVIMLSMRGNNVIQGNFFGLNMNGTTEASGGWLNEVISLSSTFTPTTPSLIGGSTPQARNVFAGNYGTAVSGDLGVVPNQLWVEGNYFGTDWTGTVIVGTHGTAVVNSYMVKNNVMAGHTGYGVWISEGGAIIQGNRIGVSATGLPLANSGVGIDINQWADQILIGGTGAGEGNIIANNGGDGITVMHNNNAGIVGNSIYNNSRLGIDLSSDGVNPNDQGDPINPLNHPVLFEARTTASQTTISGTLQAAANRPYRIDFYSNPSCDPTGYGEGQIYLGSSAVSTNASGDASYNVSFPVAVTSGHFITATTTEAQYDTSEFSQCSIVNPPEPPPAPSNLSHTSTAQTSLTVSWQDNSTDEIAFLLEHSADGTSGWVQIATLGANVTSFTHINLMCGSPHFYRVRAERSGVLSGYSRLSAYSPVYQAAVQACTIPAAPSNLQSGHVGPAALVVWWTDNSNNESEFRIERSEDGTTWTQIGTAQSNQYPYPEGEGHFDMYDLLCGKPYHFRVIAANSAGASAPSAVHIASTPCPPDVEPWALFEREFEFYSEVDFLDNVVAGDFNNDGRDDIATSNHGYLRVYYQMADGSLNVSLIASDAHSVALDAGDLNGDGRDDLAVGDYVYLQNPAGGFLPRVEYDCCGSLGTVGVIKIADLNGDGRDDLIRNSIPGSGNGAGEIRIRYQQANGTLGAESVIPVSTTTFHRVITTGDLNNDGRTDIARTDGGYNVQIFLQNSDGTFAAPVAYTIGQPYTPQGLAVGDVTGDGLDDVVMLIPIGSSSSQLAVFAQNASGTLNTPTLFNSVANAYGLELADVNFDGLLDALAVTLGTGKVIVHRQLVSGGFGASEVFGNNGRSLHDLAIGDFNNDCAPDVAVASFVSGDGMGVLYHTPSGLGCRIPPATPTAFTLTVPSGYDVVLSWRDNATNETAYVIERSIFGVAQVIATVPANSTGYTDPLSCFFGVPSYRMRAYDASTGLYSSYTAVVSPAAWTSCVPSNVKVVNSSDSHRTIEWTDNSPDESSFTVERAVRDANGQYGSFQAIGTVGANITTFTDNSFDCGVTYGYRIRVTRDSDGKSGVSSIAGGLNACSPAGAPYNIRATAVSPSQVDVTWTGVAGFDEWHIFRATGYWIVPNYMEIGVVSADQTVFHDTTATCSLPAYYKVVGYNTETGQDTWASNNAAYIVFPCPPLQAPSDLTGTAVSPTRIDLSWVDQSVGESAFYLEQSTDGSTSWTMPMNPIVSTTGSGTGQAYTYSFTNLPCNLITTYQYRMRVHRSVDGQYSGYTTVITVTRPPCPAPAAPTNLRLNGTPTTTSISVTFTDQANDETEFRMERSLDGTSGWTQVATRASLAGTGTSASLSSTGLTCSTTYYFRVFAYRSGDQQLSAASTVFNASTAVCPPPSNPSSFSAVPQNSTDTRLTWTDNATNESGFQIERSLDNVTYTVLTTVAAASSSGTTVTYTDTTGTCDARYYYRVKAYRTSDNSYSSGVSGQMTGRLLPCPPTNPAATALSQTQIQLSWTDNSISESDYRVQRSLNGVDGWVSAATVAAVTGSGSTITYTNASLTCGTTYYYRVYANRTAALAGQSPYSSVVSATTHICAPTNTPTNTPTATPTRTPTATITPSPTATTVNLGLTPGFYEENATGIEYRGTWTTDSNANASGGQYRYALGWNSYISFKFTGSKLTLYRAMAFNRDAIDVCIISVNGTSCWRVQNYSASVIWQAPVSFSVAQGTYSVSIANTLPHTYFDLDAVRVEGDQTGVTATPTLTPTSSVTPSITPSLTPTNTPTATATATTVTQTPSLTPTDTPTATATVTPSLTPTITPSATATNTATATVTPSLTPSVTPSATATNTATATLTPTVTNTPSASLGLTPGLYQENNAGIVLTGAWLTDNNANASGGQYRFTNSTSAKVNFTFTGNQLTLYRAIAFNRGAMSVCIDGVCQTVQNYSASVVWQAPVSFNVAQGTHTVEIRNLSTAYIDLDAIRIEGEAGGATVTPSTTPTNTLTATPTVTPSVTPSNTPTATATATNTATATLTPSNTPTHTLTPTATLTPTHTPTPTATNTPTATVTAGGALGVGFYQENNAGVTFTGAWLIDNNANASGGQYRYTNSTSAKVNFSFTGSKLTLYRAMAYNRGAMQVCIDGVCQTVQNYSASVVWQAPVSFNVTSGTHTVEIRNSSNAYIDLDAIRVE